MTEQEHIAYLCVFGLLLIVCGSFFLTFSGNDGGLVTGVAFYVLGDLCIFIAAFHFGKLWRHK